MDSGLLKTAAEQLVLAELKAGLCDLDMVSDALDIDEPQANKTHSVVGIRQEIVFARTSGKIALPESPTTSSCHPQASRHTISPCP